MDVDILDAVGGLGEKEVEGVVGRRQVAVHAVGHEPLGIVHVGRRPPRVEGKLDLVAGGTELGGRCADHGVVGDAEQGQGDEDADNNEDDRLDRSFPKGFLCP